jgi:hypothetical protein
MASPNLSVADLQRGDVLLYHGASFVASMIRLLDGGDYSHASVYEGGGNVVEALSAGLARDEVATSVDGSLPVDVFRYFDQKGTVLGDPALPADPINHVIDTYMAEPHRYAYEDILLLALLTSTRRLPIGWVPGLELILRNILDSAAEVVSKLIAQGREPLICSEFVYRVFNEADPGGKYKIFIVGSDTAGTASVQSLAAGGPYAEATVRTVTPADAAALADLQLRAQSFLRKYNVAKSVRTHDQVASTLAVANFVTPRDLQLSPNLHRLGTITI